MGLVLLCYNSFTIFLQNIKFSLAIKQFHFMGHLSDIFIFISIEIEIVYITIDRTVKP